MPNTIKTPKNSYPRAERRIYRLRHVMDTTGFGRAWIYQLMADGKFPKAIRIGKRAVGWNSAEVDSWVAAKLGEEC